MTIGVHKIFVTLGAACCRGWHRISLLLLGNRCRYYPSCSVYMAEALEEYGVFRGFSLGICRLLRCNALFPGGFEPVKKRGSVRQGR